MYKAVIIDDEPIIVEGLTKGLSWEKNNCIVAGSATNGEEGIKLIRATKPDILITDISMPRLDGLTMIAALKSEFPDMQITILTGYREFDYARKAIELGVTRFLLKPSKFAELEEAIEVMTEKLGAEIDRSGFGLLKDADGADADAFSTDDQGEDTDNSKASSFIVNNALEYMREHYNEKLRLSDVADIVYVSQWHLSKLLNKNTGKSFFELLNAIRIEQAILLLRNPGLRISDIAEQVGFQDLAHFSRVFKKSEGMSANEYRNNLLI